VKDKVIYSEAFKIQIVRELESGKFSSCYTIAAHYGIKGGSTVYKWAKKYGRNNLIGKVLRVETVNERNLVKEQGKQIRELQALVSNMALDLAISNTYLEIACKQANISDIEEFKKKTRGIAHIKLPHTTLKKSGALTRYARG